MRLQVLDDNLTAIYNRSIYYNKYTIKSLSCVGILVHFWISLRVEMSSYPSMLQVMYKYIPFRFPVDI